MDIKKNFLQNDSIVSFSLILSAFFLYLNFFNDYAVPSSDFFAFRGNALSYLNFELPWSLKREPIYPLIIGLSSLIFTKTILFSANVINLVCALINVYLVYRIAFFFLGSIGFFVALIFAVNPTTVAMANQPLLETCLISFILVTIYVSINEKKWSYLAAFFSSLTRYEAVLLIPILVFKDFFITKRRKRALILGFLSSTGICVWMILSVMRYYSQVNPYVGQISLGLGEVRFLQNCIKSIFHFVPNILLKTIPFEILSATTIVLCLIGITYLVKKSFRSSFTLIAFFLCYFLIHTLYPSVSAPLRYVLPVLWIFYIFIFKGLQILLSLLHKKLENFTNTNNFDNKRIFKIMSLCGLLVPFFINLLFIRKFLIEGEIFLEISYCLFILTILIFVIRVWSDRLRGGLILALAIFFMINSFVGSSIFNANSNWISKFKYGRKQQREIAEWYAQIANPGDKMAVSEPFIMIYFSQLNREYFVPLRIFKSQNGSEFIKELKDKKVKYVVWDKQYMQHRQIKYKDINKQYGAHLMPFLFGPEINSQVEIVKEIYVGEKKLKRAIIFKVKDI
jgi:hypothetical protein